jgi:phospholipase C
MTTSLIEPRTISSGEGLSSARLRRGRRQRFRAGGFSITLRSMRVWPTLVSLFSLGLAPGCGQSTSPTAFTRLGHIVVIYLENHSFDNLYGQFAHADGAATAMFPPQVDASGAPYATLPPVLDTDETPPVPDSRFPSALANAPFDIGKYVPPNRPIPDLVHRFYQERAQLDSGRNDRFAQLSDAQGLTMGFYQTAGLPLAAYANDYVLCDRFFHAGLGGSFFNHIWLVAAAPPRWPGAPADTQVVLDPAGNLVTDGIVTPDGYAVNTAYSVNQPHPAGVDGAHLMPSLTLPTIGDLLTNARVPWTWYAGGWDDAIAGRPDPDFEFHHQPFVYFASYKDGSPEKAQHLRDETEFFTAARTGYLPAVSFVKPLGPNTEHPGYTDVITGEQHAAQLIQAVQNGPNWDDTAIIVTYDENGGFWDHVSAPARDRWGPGTRVPAIVISRFARKHFVDHTQYDTTAILGLLIHRFGLPDLGTVVGATTPDLRAAFEN